MIDNLLDQSKQVITKKYLGSIIHHYREDNAFYFNDHTSTIQIKVISDDIIRVKLAPHNTFLPEFSYAIQEYPHVTSHLEFIELPDFFKISTASVQCFVKKSNFKVTFTDQDGLVINQDALGIHYEEHSEFGGYYVYCSKQIQEGEQFYGLGDKTTDFNLLGKRFQLWSSDTYAFERGRDPLYRNIPFYIGLHHEKTYGLFFDNTFRSFFDFGCENKELVSFWADGGEMNYYFINGPHMMDVVKRYSSLTGTHPLPPTWALGYHQCRWSYYPEEKVTSIAKTFREKQIPCDAIYLDIDYMDGFRCFTWNKEYFPDPKKMISGLSEMGFKTVVIIDPGIKVDPNYRIFKEGTEKKYFCRRSDDYFMEGSVWPGKCQFPDFTNPKVRKWWGKLFKEDVDNGVSGVWNDMNEPSVFGSGTFPNDVRHNYDGYRGSHRKAHNVYGMQMVRATYEGLKKIQKNKRPFTITRSAYAGTQRYSSTWTGDNVASWDHLHLANIMCQRLSIGGMSFCGSDIGGFTGIPDGELYTRWVQFATFSPLMRTHSAGDTTDREPWSFGPVYEEVCKKFIELRYKLLPYIYSAFWENHRYGFPILRPLIMLDQENPDFLNREDEFCFGDKILISPVSQPKIKGKEVCLPKGKWYSYWTNKVYEGGKKYWIETPLDTIPIFVRAGSVIPEYPVMQHTNQFEFRELRMNVYFSEAPVNSFLFEDHGDTFAYEQNIYSEKKFQCSGSQHNFVILQETEGLYTPRYDNYDFKIFGVPFNIKNILIDGKELKHYSIDNTTNTLEFRIAKSFSRIDIKNS